MQNIKSNYPTCKIRSSNSCIGSPGSLKETHHSTQKRNRARDNRWNKNEENQNDFETYKDYERQEFDTFKYIKQFNDRAESL